MCLKKQAPTPILRSLLSVALAAANDVAICTLRDALRYLEEG